MQIDPHRVHSAWESLKTDIQRHCVKKGEFPHAICYFDLNFAEHLELQRMAKLYFRKRKRS